MNVYVVHWGEYSDSGIVGVFAKREDAEAVATARNRHAHQWLGYGVTEYAVQGDPTPPDSYYIHVDAFDGEWTVSERLYALETNPDWIGRDCFDDRDGMHSVWVEVDPTTFDAERDCGRLIKIAQDRLAQWQAEQEGIA